MRLSVITHSPINVCILAFTWTTSNSLSYIIYVNRMFIYWVPSLHSSHCLCHCVKKLQEPPLILPSMPVFLQASFKKISILLLLWLSRKEGRSEGKIIEKKDGHMKKVGQKKGEIRIEFRGPTIAIVPEEQLYWWSKCWTTFHHYLGMFWYCFC